jgi:hypothetical protein
MNENSYLLIPALSRPINFVLTVIIHIFHPCTFPLDREVSPLLIMNEYSFMFSPFQPVGMGPSWAFNQRKARRWNRR